MKYRHRWLFPTKFWWKNTPSKEKYVDIKSTNVRLMSETFEIFIFETLLWSQLPMTLNWQLPTLKSCVVGGSSNINKRPCLRVLFNIYYIILHKRKPGVKRGSWAWLKVKMCQVHHPSIREFYVPNQIGTNMITFRMPQ